ncbi:S-adenosyl-L-methionine-dependent methyltransferase [Pterulicium gracile]|uniref:S-adenosyl-L-methionine-dependent methyltransferase n=1 Tax=Pterulicium gracile TaxID=1884261 RepID=A0A5C3QHV7_9AGAR|nr:S-adenosyl-L-methionine-dependent methyltransferase [Pterula gracilis]
MSSALATSDDGASSTLAQTNQKHYDSTETAARFNNRPDALEMGRRVAKAMKNMYGKFDEETTEVLDFACGSGLLSMHLAADCKSILGVDISQSMVDLYNERVSNQGIEPSEMHAVVKDLKGNPDELEGRKFDVIVCSMSYHHFDSILDVTRALLTHLRPSGSILVVDMHKYAPTTEQAEKVKSYDFVNHDHIHGFTEEQFRTLFVDEMGLSGFKREIFGHAYMRTGAHWFVFPEGEGEEADEKAREEAGRKVESVVPKGGHGGHGHNHGHPHGHGQGTDHGQHKRQEKVEFFIAMGTKSVSS